MKMMIVFDHVVNHDALLWIMKRGVGERRLSFQKVTLGALHQQKWLVANRFPHAKVNVTANVHGSPPLPVLHRTTPHTCFDLFFLHTHHVGTTNSSLRTHYSSTGLNSTATVNNNKGQRKHPFFCFFFFLSLQPTTLCPNSWNKLTQRNALQDSNIRVFTLSRVPPGLLNRHPHLRNPLELQPPIGPQGLYHDLHATDLLQTPGFRRDNDAIRRKIQPVVVQGRRL